METCQAFKNNFHPLLGSYLCKVPYFNKSPIYEKEYLFFVSDLTWSCNRSQILLITRIQIRKQEQNVKKTSHGSIKQTQKDDNSSDLLKTRFL